MSSMKFLFVILFFLASCSHDYLRGKPDFTKTGPESKAEYEKFKLDYFNRRISRFKGDGPFNSTRSEKFLPVLKEISPKGYQEFRSMDADENLSLGLFAVWLATVFIKPSGWYWVGAGAFLGHRIYMDKEYQDVRDQYNKDLKSKFSPALSWSTGF